MDKKDKEIQRLKEEVKSNIGMYHYFADRSRDRGKAISILLPLIPEESLMDIFAEYWDLKQNEKKQDTE